MSSWNVIQISGYSWCLKTSRITNNSKQNLFHLWNSMKLIKGTLASKIFSHCATKFTAGAKYSIEFFAFAIWPIWFPFSSAHFSNNSSRQNCIISEAEINNIFFLSLENWGNLCQPRFQRCRFFACYGFKIANVWSVNPLSSSINAVVHVHKTVPLPLLKAKVQKSLQGCVIWDLQISHFLFENCRKLLELICKHFIILNPRWRFLNLNLTCITFWRNHYHRTGMFSCFKNTCFEQKIKIDSI